MSATAELAVLYVIASTSRQLLARYPFDSKEEMAPLWRQLALLMVEWDRTREIQ
jgi:hypothetical protein